VIPERYRAVAELERALGDARAPANPCGHLAAVERDERAGFPHALAADLRDAGVHLSYLPSALGGRLSGFDVTLALARAGARRDLNAMPATMLSVSAAISVQLHGSAEQQARVAELIARGATVAFALSEADTGSDVVRNACRLEDDGGMLRLTGHKWCVGRGERCEATYLVARSGGRGPGAFSSVLLEHADLPEEAMRVGPPLHTSGMRGIEFADYEFRGCPVSRSALVGRPGEGLEAAMKAQQIVRMLSAAGNLGCADTALLAAVDFVVRRELGRGYVIDSPIARRELALAAATLIGCEIAALSAARAVHLAPERFALASAVVKQVATTLSQSIIERSSTVLGARGVLAEGVEGIVQKARRDNAVVRVIDTSPIGNLRSVAMQLPRLGAVACADSEVLDRLELAFTLDADLPAFEPDRLSLDARGRDDVLEGLPLVSGRTLRALADGPAAARCAQLVEELRDALAALPSDAARARSSGPEAQLDLAERLCLLHTAAAAVHLWWFNRDLVLWGEPPGASGWLTACLSVLLARAAGRDARTAAADCAPALDAVLALRAGGRLFSSVPIPLAGAQLAATQEA
jgi:alkylation response protein AidB-like acyl-CoA dehydrogenase